MTTNPTAVRTRKGDSATILITFPDGLTKTVGGMRAARAEAVVVWRYRDDSPWEIGCRSDAAAAEAEAHRELTATSFRHRGIEIPRTPAVFAAAIPVEERP